MKKLLLFLILIYQSTLLSQTVLTSFPIDLNKSKEYNQILNIENERTHDVFVFIKNKEKLTILKYNRALFLNSQYTFPLKNLDYKMVKGCSFSEDGNPTLYLSSSDLKNSTPFNHIITIKYYLENKTYTISNFKFPLTEFIITTFQMNNSFHILAQNRIMKALIVYTFQDGKALTKVFNFSSFIFQDKNNQSLTFNMLTKAYPIEKIELDDYNPMDKNAHKSKVYIQNNHIVLTLDYNPKNTQAFDIDLENLELSEKNFPQSILQDSNKRSNSFYNEEKLYQVNASESELLLDIKDFNSGQTLKNISVLKKDDKSFKNAPLFIQKDYRKPKEVKKPKRFLQHLYTLNISLSVFNTKQNTFITFGGSPKMEDKEKPFQSHQFYVDNLNQDDIFSDFDFPLIVHFKSVYFESILNRNFEFVDQGEQPPAFDKLYYFLSKNKKATFTKVLKLRDYYILGYYDVKTKQYIMRKFTDGFD
ncbi:MAG: hypothetical protein V4497_04915 [Bacteroidota bacterium]